MCSGESKKKQYLLNKKRGKKMAIDKRRHYILVVDTETANTPKVGNKLMIDSGLVYDVGWCVMDTRGNVYEERSFINFDVFYKMADVMQSAYYKDKISHYWQGIIDRTHEIGDTYSIRMAMLADMKKYNITEVVAHNARFDITVLNATQRYMTKSKFKYWFPCGTEVWDSLKMARSVILKMPSYKTFCETHDLVGKGGRLPASAEALYKFIINDPTFEESHTGLEDVRIERAIIAYCYKQKKKMKKVLYS